jgi:hypothetical protein
MKIIHEILGWVYKTALPQAPAVLAWLTACPIQDKLTLSAIGIITSLVALVNHFLPVAEDIDPDLVSYMQDQSDAAADADATMTADATPEKTTTTQAASTTDPDDIAS